MKYRYEIGRTVVQFARVTIEADSEVDADNQVRRIVELHNSIRCPVQLEWWVDEVLAEGFALAEEK